MGWPRERLPHIVSREHAVLIALPDLPSRPLCVVGAALLLAFSAPVQAGDWLLAATDTRVVPGQRFEVVVVAAGSSAQWPDRLPARIELPGGSPQVAIELVAMAAAPGAAGQRRYFARWPMEVNGVVTLALADQPQARLLLAAAATTATDSAELSPAGALEQMAPVARMAAGTPPVEPSGLAFHEPMYFLVGGRDPVSARFQFSFKYRIFAEQGIVGENIPVATGLYFGFTQTSLWDLQSESKPFRDSSFRPTLFYSVAATDAEDRLALTLSGGYEHESNGKEDTPSRSIDLLFLRAEGRYLFADGRTYLGVAPKLWTYLDRDDNPDIARYRGHGELALRLGRDDGLLFSALVRRGTAGKIGTQYDLSYPIRRSVFSGVGAFVHLQAYRGYGETLLEYDEKKDPQYRLGISLVR
ncbi:MAG TPA: hypothetical protein DCY18_01090 [Thauera sp.]|nr:hypothetical protein [Thauera sp.]HAY08526.1 hypothetical protein [Thauera sp.]